MYPSVPCGPGFYYNENSQLCSECATGEYQDEADQISCKQCPSIKEMIVSVSYEPRISSKQCARKLTQKSGRGSEIDRDFLI